MQKRLKVLSMVAMSAILMGTNIQGAYAFENQSLNTYTNNSDITNENLVTYIEPLHKDELSPQVNLEDNYNSAELYGLNRPTSVHNLKTQGKMTFRGSAQNTTLYSNSRFKGSSSAEYRIENHSNNKLIVRVRKVNVLNTTVETLTVPANTAMGGFLNLDSTQEYFLSFDGYNVGPTNFSGYVAHNR